MNDFTEVTVQKDVKYQGGIFTVEHHVVSLPNGKQSTRDIVLHNGAVAVLVVHEGKILLVRQYRKAIEAHTLEIPAGKLDHDGESPLEAAKRELEEETKLSANEWRKVVDLVPTPGYCNEKIHLYEAKGIHHLENAAPLDEDEFVSIEWIPVEEVIQKIHHGEITDAKTIIAVQYAALHQ